MSDFWWVVAVVVVEEDLVSLESEELVPALWIAEPASQVVLWLVWLNGWLGVGVRSVEVVVDF